jgi:epsin
MLRQFHYIDQNGKDQGVNVRNRAQELAKMLNDVDTIRAERKKARSNRNKFGGVEGGMGMSGGFSTGSRYGGFGSEEPQGNYGGYSGGVYGDGGGFGGATSEFQDSGRKGDRFEEYDEYDEGAVASPGRRKSDARAGTATSTARREKKAETPKKKEPEPDLLFDDDPVLTSSSTSNGKQPATDDSFAADDDDFDDFQSAAPPAASIPPPSTVSSVLPPPVSTTTSHTQFAAPQPVSAAQPNLNSLAGFQSISPAPSSTSTSTFSSPPLLQQQPAPMQMQPQIQKPTTYQPKGPNYFTSVQSPQAPTTTTINTTPSFNKPSPSPFGGNKPSTASKPASGDAFNSLWSTASATAGIKTTGSAGGPKLADMAKQKSSAGIWGTSTPPPGNQGGMAGRPAGNVAPPAQGQQQQQYGGGLDDLLG